MIGGRFLPCLKPGRKKSERTAAWFLWMKKQSLPRISAVWSGPCPDWQKRPGIGTGLIEFISCVANEYWRRGCLARSRSVYDGERFSEVGAFYHRALSDDDQPSAISSPEPTREIAAPPQGRQCAGAAQPASIERTADTLGAKGFPLMSVVRLHPATATSSVGGALTRGRQLLPG